MWLNPDPASSSILNRSEEMLNSFQKNDITKQKFQYSNSRAEISTILPITFLSQNPDWCLWFRGQCLKERFMFFQVCKASSETQVCREAWDLLPQKDSVLDGKTATTTNSPKAHTWFASLLSQLDLSVRHDPASVQCPRTTLASPRAPQPVSVLCWFRATEMLLTEDFWVNCTLGDCYSSW